MIVRTLQNIGRLFISTSIVVSCLVATAFAQENEIIGTWDCGLTVEDVASGTSASANFATVYDADGSYTRDGDMRIVVAALQLDISITVDEAGSWRLVDSTGLAETALEIDFSSAAGEPSQMEQMMLQAMEQEASAALAQEETAQILSLTETTMELQDDDGATLSCAKA